ncbi:MAG: hypothetical protein AMXMBFR61_19010 [Fimbriimonadales bacterium]
MRRPIDPLVPDNQFRRFVDDWAPRVLGLGIVLTLIVFGYLIYASISFGSSTAGNLTVDDVARLQNSLKIAGTWSIIALLILSLGMILMYAEEGSTGPLLLLFGAVIYWGIPMFIIMSQGGQDPGNKELFDQALGTIRQGTLAVVVPGLLMSVITVALNTGRRGTVGVRKDQMQYGKEVKEEPEVVNRFMGKCWQLPYCRKFIRVKCPIYLSRRCCWRERVGCMCEEKVISQALEGTVIIPKDPVAAAQYIPYNKKLTPAEKAERCRNCVIYNEHQRHKYRLLVPLVLLGTIGPVVYWHGQFTEWTGLLLMRLDSIFGRFSVASVGLVEAEPGSQTILEAFRTTPIAVQILLVSAVMLVLAYALRLIEYALFKWKI